MKLLHFFLLLLLNISLSAQSLYFPPNNNNEWENITPLELSWKIEKIDSLYSYLDEKNSKAFILLKDGKIVLEKYFGTFEKDSVWYWASAGKTLTATLVGIAQQDGLLNINDKTSDYLGKGWTSLSEEKEELITIRHQLTMTTGLDYLTEDLDCTEPECLKYKADAGTQWFYHNAPYTLLDKVVTNATGKNYNLYFAEKIKALTGMNGAWFKLGFNNVYFSTARSMARFGLLMLNKGNWDGEEVIKDKNYVSEMLNTSQNLNKSYGYLWWLNGKDSYKVPQLNYEFPGALFPAAPVDTYAALGKNGQCLHISPSNGIVWVRMGEDSGEALFIAKDFSSQIWEFLNEIMDIETSIADEINTFSIFPNPASDYIEISINKPSCPDFIGAEGSDIAIYDVLGNIVKSESIHPMTRSHRMNVANLPAGVYFVKVGAQVKKILVVR
jgi:CubicO group peptidase (beta-lactamase class C family)